SENSLMGAAGRSIIEGGWAWFWTTSMRHNGCAIMGVGDSMAEQDTGSLRLSHEGKAIGERLWSHAVGVTNRASVTTGTDPATGLRAREEESPGTGVAGRWNNQHFVLTAKHVVVSASPSDLSFFVRERGDLKTQHASEITERDASAPIPLNDDKAVI